MTLSRGPMVKLINWLIAGAQGYVPRETSRGSSIVRERTATSSGLRVTMANLTGWKYHAPCYPTHGPKSSIVTSVVYIV